MRIAFLTPEYPSELPDLGGIATYVQRIVRQLQYFGHEPEVFVTSAKDSATISGDGVPVHRIGWSRHPKILRIGFRASLRLVPSYTWDASIDLLLKSHALARALERRHTLRRLIWFKARIFSRQAIRSALPWPGSMRFVAVTPRIFTTHSIIYRFKVRVCSWLFGKIVMRRADVYLCAQPLSGGLF